MNEQLKPSQSEAHDKARGMATKIDIKSIAQRLREYNFNPHHINPVSDAFHALIVESADTLSAMSDELGHVRDAMDRAKDAMNDPLTIFVNMKCGIIARPSLRNLLELYSEVPNGEEELMLEIAKLKAEIEAMDSLSLDANRYRHYRMGFVDPERIDHDIDDAIKEKQK